MSKQHQMGPFMLTVLVTSSMMGSGVFLLPSNLAEIGSISVLGWSVTAVGALALALMFAKLGLFNPRAGGPYAYVRQACGDYLGFQTVCSYWLGNVVGNVAVSLAAVSYLSYFFPSLNTLGYGAIAAIGVIWLFTLINAFGARMLGRAQSFTITFMLIPVVGTAIFGWFWFEADTFTSAINLTDQSNWHAISKAAGITLWAFIGIESASVSAAVAKNPNRDIPLATIAGIIIATSTYILSSSAIMGIIPNEQLAMSSAPFAITATLALGPLAGKFVTLCAVFACLGSLGGWMLLIGQSAKAVADDGLFPHYFSITSKRDVPIVSLLTAAVIMTTLLLLTISPHISQQFETVILTAVFLTLLPYLYTAVSALILLRRYQLSKPQVVFYSVVSIIAAIYAFWTISNANLHIVFYGFLFLLLTVPAYAFVLLSKHEKV